MRDHVRDMIHRARQGTDAGRACGVEAGVLDVLAADAVRLARLAAAVHAAEAARSSGHLDAFTLEPVTSGEQTQ